MEMKHGEGWQYVEAIKMSLKTIGENLFAETVENIMFPLFVHGHITPVQMGVMDDTHLRLKKLYRLFTFLEYCDNKSEMFEDFCQSVENEMLRPDIAQIMRQNVNKINKQANYQGNELSEDDFFKKMTINPTKSTTNKKAVSQPEQTGELLLQNFNVSNVPLIECDISKADVQKKIKEIGLQSFNLPRGCVVIINNQDFRNTRLSSISLTDREGTYYDASAMEFTLREIGFCQIFSKRDRTANQIIEDLTKAANEILSEDSFVCVILSHGVEGKIFGVDGELVDIQNLVDIVTKKLPSTTPKVFIIQACRTAMNQPEVPNPMPSETSILMASDNVVPTEVVASPPINVEHELDFLTDAEPIESSSVCASRYANVVVALSTVKGYVSKRDVNKGSWFIQALVYTIREYSHEDDLDGLMTRVKRLVSEHSKKEHGLAQIPDHRTTMINKFFFFPGVKTSDVDQIKQRGN